MEEVPAQVDSISFFRSYHEAAQLLTGQQRLRFYDGIAAFAFEGEVPDFTDDTTLRLCWSLVEPNLRKSIENRQNGKRGGRPRKQAEEEQT